jgi:hypothetical protein
LNDPFPPFVCIQKGESNQVANLTLTFGPELNARLSSTEASILTNALRKAGLIRAAY